MQQTDWISSPERAPFKDIRNTRSSAAEQKAVALFQLGELITKIPPRIKAGGTVDAAREYQASLKSAKRVAANSRASVNEINSAINSMRMHWA